MSAWLAAYLVAGVFTSSVLYQPAESVHLDQTSPLESLAIMAFWPIVWLCFLFLMLAFLADDHKEKL